MMQPTITAFSIFNSFFLVIALMIVSQGYSEAYIKSVGMLSRSCGELSSIWFDVTERSSTDKAYDFQFTLPPGVSASGRWDRGMASVSWHQSGRTVYVRGVLARSHINAGLTFYLTTGQAAEGTVTVSGIEVRRFYGAFGSRLNIQCPQKDFGDAPASYGAAEHDLENSTVALYIGSEEPDYESSAEHSSDASGDGADEDGLIIPLWQAGNVCEGYVQQSDGSLVDSSVTMTSRRYCISVPVTNLSSDVAQLLGWIDFNQDGSYEDNERAVTRHNSAGDLFSNVPGDISDQAIVLYWDNISATKLGPFVRLRLSNSVDFAGTLSPVDPTTEGEAEDHGIDQTQVYDYGDAPMVANVSSSAHASHQVSQLFLGAGISAEDEARPSSNAHADGYDDGVSFDDIWAGGSEALITVTASRKGYLSAWADFDHNDLFDDTGVETLFQDVEVYEGENALCLTLPQGGNDHILFVRFRLNSETGITPTGEGAEGEVEDYAVVYYDNSDKSLPTAQCTP